MESLKEHLENKIKSFEIYWKIIVHPQKVNKSIKSGISLRKKKKNFKANEIEKFRDKINSSY